MSLINNFSNCTHSQLEDDFASGFDFAQNVHVPPTPRGELCPLAHDAHGR